MSQPQPAFAPHGVGADDYEQLRIALVMNGGVSLAVWIGGVTHEVNRAVSGQGVYGGLLALTATTARVDVISGTSAGGINGAMLALARTYDVGLDPVRDLWLDKGSLDRLLRRATDTSASSLLLGNERFFDDLRGAFRNLQSAGRLREPGEVPIDLTLTTTVLNGEPKHITDDLGQVVTDVTHRGRFRFRRGAHLPGEDPFAKPDIADRLALAARATASFPIAFEPMFCPVNTDAPHEDPRLHDMKDAADFRRSRYLLDGGILDNKPLEAAVEAITGQRASGEVRRVLAYVVPAPGETGIAKADDPDTAPTAGAVALASLFELPRVESISRELAQVLERNAAVRRRRETRAALVRELGRDGMRPLASTLFGVYQRRRRLGAAEYIVDEIASGLARLGEGKALGRRGREWLVRTIAERPDVPWVPAELPAAGESRMDVIAGRWTWGSYTVEHMADLLLELFRRALIVSPLLDPSAAPLRERLRAWLGLSHELAAAIPRARAEDRGFWSAQAESLAAALAQANREGQVAAWLDTAAAASTARKRTVEVSARLAAVSGGPAPAGEVTTNTALGWFASTIAEIIGRGAADLREAATLGLQHARTGEDRRAAQDLLAYVEYLTPAGSPPGALPPVVLEQLLSLEVVQYAVGAHRDHDDQYVEFVQISAEAAHPVGGPSSPREKLAGAQIANFGGFYKKAWRANDWMFGRLDGSSRLVRVLLNPARLARVYPGDVESVVAVLRRIAIPPDVHAANREFLEREWSRREPAMRRELAYLADPDLPVPEQLPETANTLLLTHQLEILRSELPVIASSAQDDRDAGAGNAAPSREFISAVAERVGAKAARADWDQVKGEELPRLFQRCAIAQERITGEFGSDLFTGQVTRTLAVAVTLLSGSSGGLGFVGPLLKALQLPLVAVDAVVQNALRKSRASAFMSGLLLAGSLAVALLALLTPLMPGLVAVVGSAIFVALVAVALRRRPVLLVMWLVLVAFLAVMRWQGWIGPDRDGHSVRARDEPLVTARLRPSPSAPPRPLHLAASIDAKALVRRRPRVPGEPTVSLL